MGTFAFEMRMGVPAATDTPLCLAGDRPARCTLDVLSSVGRRPPPLAPPSQGGERVAACLRSWSKSVDIVTCPCPGL